LKPSTKRKARLAPGSFVETGKQRRDNNTADPREFQGIANRHQSAQRAPRWNRPSGADALAALQAAFAPHRPYAVICCKRPGCEVVFSVCDSEDDANRVVAQLAAIGRAARAAPARDDDVPGRAAIAMTAVSRSLGVRRKNLRFANSYSRMPALLSLSRAPDFWSLVGEEWSCCDNISQYRMPLIRLMESERRNRGFPIRAAMSPNAMNVFAQLPDVVTIWRGCYSTNRMGLSWTLDRTVAAKFPFLLRYRQARGEPLVLEATIRRDDIAFLLVDLAPEARA
jgi:hypothetical protein